MPEPEAVQVSILQYAAGSVSVSNVVYFQPSQTDERDTFAQLLSTNPQAVFDGMETSHGLVTAMLGQASPPPLSPPLLSPPSPFQSSAQDAGGDDVTLPAVTAGGGLAMLILAVLMGRRLYRRASRPKEASMPQPDKLVEVMSGTYKDSAEDWVNGQAAATGGQAQATDGADSAGIEETDLCEVPAEEKADQSWVNARRMLRGTHQLEWSELEMTKTIGSGSYGQVFLGRWRADEVAIKVVSLENHNSEVNTAAFIHEVRVAFSACDTFCRALWYPCDVSGKG
jgi:hypothetical protein